MKTFLVKIQILKKKTNYIQSKIKSYNRETNINANDDVQKIKINNSQVVNLRGFEKGSRKNKNEGTDNKKKKKFRFFSPDQQK